MFEAFIMEGARQFMGSLLGGELGFAGHAFKFAMDNDIPRSVTETGFYGAIAVGVATVVFVAWRAIK